MSLHAHVALIVGDILFLTISLYSPCERVLPALGTAKGGVTLNIRTLRHL